MVSQEPVLNALLAQTLRACGLDAMAEQSVASVTADIKIDFPNHVVLIECEKLDARGSRAKKVEAVKDCLKRLDLPMQHGGRDADAVIALVYPPSCNETNLQSESTIEYSVVLPKHVELSVQPSVLSRNLSWTKAPISSLAQRIQALDQDIGEPDALARNLDRALQHAASILNPHQRKTLCDALNFGTRADAQSDFAGAKRCFLVIASAAMFHARLDLAMPSIRPNAADRPQPIGECLAQSDIVAASSGAWNQILEIDYKPIFEAACLVLNASLHTPHFSWAIGRVVTEALTIMRDSAGLRHDLLGRIFHKILEDARFDGSYYTSTPAAVILAGLAISNFSSDELRHFTVVDPACGTGTLLMATAERIRMLLGEGCSDYNYIVNSVLHGFDINLTATHMAATTLGLISPETTFDQMNIYRAAFGEMEDGSVRAGSLELFSEDMHVPIISTSSAMRQVQSGLERQRIEKADLVIMNPPFTRDSLRHDQLGASQETKVKNREKEIFALYQGQGIVNFRSSGPAFILLADFLAKSSQSTIALILPLSAAMNPSTHGLRMLLANKYHIEYIVAAHDPTRYWFSENTKISEMLVILRKRTKNVAKDAPTTIVNLAVNPVTVHDAHKLVDQIRSSAADLNGVTVMWPSRYMLAGDWTGVQFFSPFLTQTYRKMRRNELFQTHPLDHVAQVKSTYRKVREVFRISNKPNGNALRALWHFQTEVTKYMHAATDTYVVPKDATDKWKAVWNQCSHLMMPVKVRSNLTRVFSVFAESPTLGSYWMNVELKKKSTELEMALCAWFNSTLGILSALAVRTPKILCYPDFSTTGLNNAVVPDLSKDTASRLAQVYQDLNTADLGRWADAANDNRVNLDDRICEALNVEKDLVRKTRFELAREPMCTNKQYAT